jgi:hypothetical protein
MFSSFKDRINYIDPDSGLFVELINYGDSGYSSPNPFYLSEEDMYGSSLYDREDDPKIVAGQTSEELVTIQVKHNNDTHYRVFQRYYDQYFNLFFELSDENSNMGNMKNYYLSIKNEIIAST